MPPSRVRLERARPRVSRIAQQGARLGNTIARAGADIQRGIEIREAQALATDRLFADEAFNDASIDMDDWFAKAQQEKVGSKASGLANEFMSEVYPDAVKKYTGNMNDQQRAIFIGQMNDRARIQARTVSDYEETNKRAAQVSVSKSLLERNLSDIRNTSGDMAKVEGLVLARDVKAKEFFGIDLQQEPETANLNRELAVSQGYYAAALQQVKQGNTAIADEYIEKHGEEMGAELVADLEAKIARVNEKGETDLVVEGAIGRLRAITETEGEMLIENRVEVAAERRRIELDATIGEKTRNQRLRMFDNLEESINEDIEAQELEQMKGDRWEGLEDRIASMPARLRVRATAIAENQNYPDRPVSAEAKRQVMEMAGDSKLAASARVDEIRGLGWNSAERKEALKIQKEARKNLGGVETTTEKITRYINMYSKGEGQISKNRHKVDEYFQLLGDSRTVIDRIVEKNGFITDEELSRTVNSVVSENAFRAPAGVPGFFFGSDMTSEELKSVDAMLESRERGGWPDVDNVNQIQPEIYDMIKARLEESTGNVGIDVDVSQDTILRVYENQDRIGFEKAIATGRARGLFP